MVTRKRLKSSGSGASEKERLKRLIAKVEKTPVNPYQPELSAATKAWTLKQLREQQSGKTDDLELKALNQYYGSQSYHRLGSLFPDVNVTDGVAYIMENGYSWLVTDAMAVVKTDKKLQGEEFLVVKLKLIGDKKAVMTIEDGNNNVFYTQKYDYTNAKRELTLYVQNNVVMLSGEY